MRALSFHLLSICCNRANAGNDVNESAAGKLIARVLLWPTGGTKPYILSVALSVGDVLLMSSYDDICPKVIHTGLSGKH